MLRNGSGGGVTGSGRGSDVVVIKQYYVISDYILLWASATWKYAQQSP